VICKACALLVNDRVVHGRGGGGSDPGQVVAARCSRWSRIASAGDKSCSGRRRLNRRVCSWACFGRGLNASTHKQHVSSASVLYVLEANILWSGPRCQIVVHKVVHGGSLPKMGNWGSQKEKDLNTGHRAEHTMCAVEETILNSPGHRVFIHGHETERFAWHYTAQIVHSCI
jgi:hypothetical protein